MSFEKSTSEIATFSPSLKIIRFQFFYRTAVLILLFVGVVFALQYMASSRTARKSIDQQVHYLEKHRNVRSVPTSTYLGIAALLIGGSYLAFALKKMDKQKTSYILHEDRLIAKDEFLDQAHREIRLKDVRDITLEKPVALSFFNVGSVCISMASGSDDALILADIDNPDEAFKIISRQRDTGVAA